MNVNALETPPPGVGVETVNIAVPAVAMSAAVIAACKLVLETKVVERALPFHWTAEEETKLVPVTVNVNPALPATAELGLREETEGTGLLIANVSAPEMPPPGVGVETVTVTMPSVVMSAPVIAACKPVPETKVVGRALPFHWTVEEETKLVPVTVNVNPALPATTELGLRDPPASEGIGLGAGPLEPPPHPTNHPAKTKHKIIPAMRRVATDCRNPGKLASAKTFEGRISAFIASPPAGLALRGSSELLIWSS